MNDERSTEIEQIKRASEGDDKAFARLFERYRGKVFSYAYTLSKSKETAEEVVQEVFLRLWQKRAAIDAEQNFEAYLRKITLNHVLNFFKKAARQKKLREEIFRHMEMSRNELEEQLIGKELRQIYRDAIEKLSPQRKVIYRLSRQDKLSHEQIAQLLHLSRNTVNNHLVAALKYIRTYVNAHADALPVLLLLIYGTW